jgi:hypothetical protein
MKINNRKAQNLEMEMHYWASKNLFNHKINFVDFRLGVKRIAFELEPEVDVKLILMKIRRRIK